MTQPLTGLSDRTLKKLPSTAFPLTGYLDWGHYQLRRQFQTEVRLIIVTEPLSGSSFCVKNFLETHRSCGEIPALHSSMRY